MRLYNNILLVAGSLVGATGIILINSMCKAMNRSLANVLFSGFGAVKTALSKVEGEVKPITPDDAYYILEAAGSVVVVPGYGMAVAPRPSTWSRNCWNTTAQTSATPSTRMPGHMNVLLAEADVPYDLTMCRKQYVCDCIPGQARTDERGAGMPIPASR